ncbi:MAG: ferritin-like domain-containing protein [Acidimicrobiia bacterium]
MPIDTPTDLREHLRLAIQVELSTVPPYLFAMYSIEDQQSEAALLIRSIVAEEMLHAALAANILLGVGGRPRFDTVELIPTYPSLLPHHTPPLELRLGPCTLDAVRDVFMRIEQPEEHGAPAEPDVFETLGQFYHALEIGIARLSESIDLFAEPQTEWQLSDPSFYSPVAFDAEDSGGLMQVDSPESAREAIEIIVHQGEGLSTERWADPSHQELTHYAKLVQIADGISPIGAVLSLPTDPRTADYPEALQPVSDLFNATYRYLFLVLDELFSPNQNKPEAVERMYRLMARALSTLAGFLVGHPLGNGFNAAPTFEIFEFATPDPVAELAMLAGRVGELHPDLADIGVLIVGS